MGGAEGWVTSPAARIAQTPTLRVSDAFSGVENMPNGVLAVGHGNPLRVNWKLGFALRFSGDSVLSLKPTVRQGRRLAYPRLRG